MKFKINEPIFSAEIKAVLKMSGAPDVTPDLTFGAVLLQNLLNADPQKPLAPKVKTERYELAMKIFNSREALIVDFTPAEVSIITTLIGESCATLIHGRMIEILNNPIPAKREAPGELAPKEQS